MDSLEKIDEIMLNHIKSFKYEPVKLMYKEISSGKKLRSKLILKIAGDTQEAIELCAIVELIHAASLLHDDVIDGSDTRRGKPSINYSYGAKNAVMLGDVLYSKGYYELSKFDNFIAKTISDAVSKLSIGELMDVRLGESFNEDIKMYESMIYNKTAVLIEASAKCAAFLAGFDVDKFGIYGRNLGIAFQIVDDLLDITQDSKTLGKPALSDFKDGKTTLPYIYLYKALDKEGKSILKSYFKKELNDNEIFWINSKFEEYKIMEKCAKEVEVIADKALKSIEEYENKDLIKIMQNMIDRKF
ncbi:octaprenyl-diphosphate synthase [Campylobacter blaseri]|uniref:Octaprenyl-diphosphate synthase n=1 Tax=Campylobacter blaseri TaxID=2042961 RepID=A0A2P8QZK1_9BACT|nr:polyprenyl synthetase family protein [Campylobacter blaseri]PSM51671.1 octaprenyl-diphosphate synthase [Campylobacter blaseri]PSM53461.1 octaprenyl-diphosphate synthase [Campylobacter blaseri]QKF86266.1 octaprenyl-diphosphate synthase [Campylobacter blaseri]